MEHERSFEHFSSTKYEPVYAIIRVDAASAQHRGQVRPKDFTVVKVVHTPEHAQREVERLNAMNRAKGSVYGYQLTRLEKEE